MFLMWCNAFVCGACSLFLSHPGIHLCNTKKNKTHFKAVTNVNNLRNNNKKVAPQVTGSVLELFIFNYLHALFLSTDEKLQHTPQSHVIRIDL